MRQAASEETDRLETRTEYPALLQAALLPRYRLAADWALPSTDPICRVVRKCAAFAQSRTGLRPERKRLLGRGPAGLDLNSLGLARTWRAAMSSAGTKHYSTKIGK